MTDNKKCKNCDLPIQDARYYERSFCGQGCWNEYQIKKSKRQRQAVCEACGRNFISKEHKGYWLRCCSKECRKAREDKMKIHKKCQYCGKGIKLVPSLQLRGQFCSKDCHFAYKTAMNTKLITCDCCGKTIRRQNCRVATHSENKVFCSRECCSEILQRDNSPTWKGGWYLTGKGRYMILVGIYKNNKHLRTYKLRYRTKIELAVGRIMPLRLRVLHLNGDICDDRSGNLYICSSFSELKRMQNGSLVYPKKSNISYYVKNPWKQPALNYNRFEDGEIHSFIKNSETGFKQNNFNKELKKRTA